MLVIGGAYAKGGISIFVYLFEDGLLAIFKTLMMLIHLPKVAGF